MQYKKEIRNILRKMQKEGRAHERALVRLETLGDRTVPALEYYAHDPHLIVQAVQGLAYLYVRKQSSVVMDAIYRLEADDNPLVRKVVSAVLAEMTDTLKGGKDVSESTS